MDFLKFLFGNFFVRFSNFFASVVILFLADREYFATYSYVLATALLLSSLSAVSINTYLIRYFSKSGVSEEFSGFTLFTVVQFIIVFFLSYNLIGMFSDTGVISNYFYIIFFIAFFDFFTNYFYSVLNGVGLYNLIFRVKLFFSICLSLMVVLNSKAKVDFLNVYFI